MNPTIKGTDREKSDMLLNQQQQLVWAMKQWRASANKQWEFWHIWESMEDVSPTTVDARALQAKLLISIAQKSPKVRFMQGEGATKWDTKLAQTWGNISGELANFYDWALKTGRIDDERDYWASIPVAGTDNDQKLLVQMHEMLEYGRRLNDKKKERTQFRGQKSYYEKRVRPFMKQP